MTSPPILTTRTIGETENALRALLTKTLSGSGLDWHQGALTRDLSLHRDAHGHREAD